MARGRDDAAPAQRHIGLGAVAFQLAGAVGADAAQDGGQRLVGADAHHRVHLRHLAGNLALVAFGQAAGDDDFQRRVLLLVAAGQQDVLDGFLLGGLDKAAGIDDDGVRLGGVGDGLVAVGQQCVAEHVGIHLIFGAAQGYDGKFHRFGPCSDWVCQCQDSPASASPAKRSTASRMTPWGKPRRASAAMTWGRLPSASLRA